MTSQSSNRPVSALRARMIEDMTVRGFTEEAQQLHSRRAGLRGLHRPLAGQGDGGGFAPLPTSPNTDGHAAAEHQ